jgi:hypothetical protein
MCPRRLAGIPEGVETASRDQWREQFYAATKAKEPDIKETTLRSRFNRAIEELVDKEGTVETVGERFWTVASVAQRCI